MSEVSGGGFQSAHFSTSSYPVHERVVAWREVFGRTVVNVDINPADAEGFAASATITRSSTFGLIDASTSPVVQGNSRNLVVNDDVSFGGVMTARWSASQLGRNLDLLPGDGVLLSNSDIGSLTLPECRYFAFCVPRDEIAKRVKDVGSLFARRIPVSSPALPMLLRYLDLARRPTPVTTPELAAAYTGHVCDLLALVLGPTRDAVEVAKAHGLRAARLQAIIDDMEEDIYRPEFSVHTIAARYQVSVRYIQRLFEETGLTFTQFVMERRLIASRKALMARPHVPIYIIARNLGFRDVTYFNRAFRERFGCTPSDVRDSALNGSGEQEI